MLSKTKVVATLGPASAQLETVRSLIRAGASCFRLNFSHGDGASLQPYIDLVREAAREEATEVAIMADIQGPKLRIGKLPANGVLLVHGQDFIITGRKVPGNEREVFSPYEYLAVDVRPGTRLLLADGSIELEVKSVEQSDVHCQVVNGGRLYSNKGINIPNTPLSVETLTEKDRRDLQFIAGSDIDFVAISFVRRASDIAQARELLGESAHAIPVMAKLELSEALLHLPEILEAADGVMVARGDLGVELPFENVPILQKQILQRAAARGKWAMVATQMLGSMVLNPRPSRAEVSDVANAVLDGADALMLSEETATGSYPVQAVEAMTRIAAAAEKEQPALPLHFEEDIVSFAAAAAGAAISAAERLKAKAIVILGGSGLTTLLVSKWRPGIPVVAISHHARTIRRFKVLRGVYPLLLTERSSIEVQIEKADLFLLEKKWASEESPVIIVAATPLWQKKDTNTIRFHKVRNWMVRPRSISAE